MDGATPLLVVAVSSNDAWNLSRGAGGRDGPRDLIVVDMLLPFDFRAHRPGSLVAVQAPTAWIGLAPETVRSGVEHLREGNPLIGFVRDHVRHLAGVAAECPESLPDLAEPTGAIIRSMLLTSVDAAERSQSSELVAAVKRYIDEHLTDADLGAQTIAAAHHVSTRKPYSAWPTAEGRLSDYVIRRRLDRARDSLVVQQHRTIPAVARAHGFSDATHFTKRFRAAYGMTPSRWRRDHTGV
ncbi:helix-turn-helix domain-containing protein [Gordonia sp. NPDC127522]|uniref:AraC family transcriptional regulator n=1 Tax=Gordonia sp. NPDC127522 TaxID=3345390 RepID=UPI003625601B